MLNKLTFVIKGAGEMASGIAWRLHRSGFRKIVMLETEAPLAIRRGVCFSEAVYDTSKTIDHVSAKLAATPQEISSIWRHNKIAVIVDPGWAQISQIKPDIVVDAILAKRNLGTSIKEAHLVIGAGPGFTAGLDVDAVIETNRGPELGQVIHQGCPQANTSIPQQVMGYTHERVLYSMSSGHFTAHKNIGAKIVEQELIATVGTAEIRSAIAGTLRGLIRDNIEIDEGTKVADIEPRSNVNINKISDKALAIGGAVLEAVLFRYNTL